MFNQNTIKMKIKLLRSYRSQNGNATFVYGVSGSADQLAKYKEIQGDFYREDENGPLFFTVNCVGKAGKLIITSNNKIVPDMSAFDQAASLAKQYGGNFGEQLAKQAAAELIGGSGSTPTASTEEVAEEAEEDKGLGEM